MTKKKTSIRVPPQPGLSPPGTSSQLSFDEQVTLRRVAFGESPAATLRAHDLAQLRRLHLVSDGREGPQLTPSGRDLYESLPRALLRAKEGPRDLLSAVVRSIAVARAQPDER